ncbi:hypothetical protein ACFL27_01100 [candidate division CSSED10-310 bacterium]|uniref:Uncharacterized protein n=1 Tax=candidate division CSSED10-310 bacterium TaxID=2855610 RepID=A0ABV6YRE4_UNCC1
MATNREYLEKKFDQLKINRMEDSTNVMRIQIDLFLNILQEAEGRLNSEFSKKKFKSAYFGTDKTLTDAGTELIYSILENIDYEWERLIIELLKKLEEENSKKLRSLELELFQRIDDFSQQAYSAQYDAGQQIEKLRAELIEKVAESEKHRKKLLSSLRTILEQDVKQRRAPSDCVNGLLLE